MTAKKDYQVGDSVWIHGITRRNQLVKGTVIHILNLKNYTDTHYVISIPTEIEALLEIRSWQMISEDDVGPLGMFREYSKDFESTNKFLTKVGFTSANSNEENDDPTVEQIHAALEKRLDDNFHKPLILKEKSKIRRRYGKKRV